LGLHYNAGTVRHRFYLERDGYEIKKNEIKTCGDPLYCQGPFTQFFPEDPGLYTVRQEIHTKILFWWQKVGEYTSNEIQMGFPSCPRGRDDGANCSVGKPPWGTSAFEWNNGLYYHPLPSCPVGSFDGANCGLGAPPTSAFIYNGHLYYHDQNGHCSVPGSSYDGANCFMAHRDLDPFIYQGRMYVEPDASTDCPMSGSSYDGANCYVYRPPSSSNSFIYNGGMYYSCVWSCPNGW